MNPWQEDDCEEDRAPSVSYDTFDRGEDDEDEE